MLFDPDTRLPTVAKPTPDDALPSFASRAPLLPVVVDAPGQIEGGWPQPEATGLLSGRCRLAAPPQGWRREDIVSAVMKVTFEDWQGGMPLVSSRELGEYRRLANEGDADHVVYQRDEFDCLTGRPHSATLAVDGQRASGSAQRQASLQVQEVVVDHTDEAKAASGQSHRQTWQTRKLMRRVYHAGAFEICVALNAQTLQRLREGGELVFFAGSDDPAYALALRRATLSVTYGQRPATESAADVDADGQLIGGLASMAGRWRLPDDSTR